MTTPPDQKPDSAPATASVTRLFPELDPAAFESVPTAAASPAAYLRIILDHLSLSQSQLAARTGLSTKHVNQVVQGLVPLSPDTALLLERALGVPSGIWIALEAARQDAAARQRARVQQGEWTTWLRHFPVRDLQDREVLDPATDAAGQVGQLLSFFRVADPEAYDRVWFAPVASGFRRAKHLHVDPYATAAWLRLAEQQADALDLAEFKVQRFAELLPRLRELTLLPDDEEALALLQQRCAAVGVAVVVVREVAGARASGAARWPNPTNPMIVLSAATATPTASGSPSSTKRPTSCTTPSARPTSASTRPATTSTGWKAKPTRPPCDISLDLGQRRGCAQGSNTRTCGTSPRRPVWTPASRLGASATNSTTT